MSREAIPKKTKDAVLDEYDHRCAVCGGARPHIHHIDEDASNNSALNLLPLCPNCHLRDQHNPTRKIDIPKLQLFRKYKDPAILKPQFHPIYLRQRFLDDVAPGDESAAEIERQAKELIDFVESFEMGNFYSKRLRDLIGPIGRAFVLSLGSGPDPNYERQQRSANSDYRKKLIQNQPLAQELLVELLRYQNWANS